MCGRFALYVGPGDLAGFFDLEPDESPVAPRYNIAPTQPVLIVRARPARGRREIVPARWGLVPPFARDLSIGNRMINARAETVATQAAFRSAFASRRCLIPASGFYEWRKEAGGRQPYFIRPADAPLLAFAGLWERWKPRDGEAVESCTILTTAANALVEPIHDRMPVVLPRSAFGAWLGEARTSADALSALLVPAPPGALTVHPVSRDVNAPTGDDPRFVEPVAVAG